MIWRPLRNLLRSRSRSCPDRRLLWRATGRAAPHDLRLFRRKRPQRGLFKRPL